MWYLYGMVTIIVMKVINSIIVLKKKPEVFDVFDVFDVHDDIDGLWLAALIGISLLSIALWPITIIYMPFAMKDILSR